MILTSVVSFTLPLFLVLFKLGRQFFHLQYRKHNFFLPLIALYTLAALKRVP
jgi:hypothetical protein